MLQAVDCVLFDAGGVLVMPDAEVIGRLLQTLDLDCSAAACHRLHFQRVHLADELAVGDWNTVDEHLAHRLGLDGRDASYAAHLFSTTFGRHRSVVVAGAPQVLGMLHESGKTLGVVSNSDGTLAERLGEAGLWCERGSPHHPLAFVVDSAVVGVAKPDPRIFRLAAEQLERRGIGPHRCLFVGDTVVNDVVPAVQSGFAAVHLDPYGLCRGNDHHHIRSLGDLTKT